MRAQCLRNVFTASTLTLCLAIGTSVSAKEGMFTPDQLPQIAKDLRKTGLKLNPNALTDLTTFPMGAIVSLGGCSASFVSDMGLVVTNHHCARGSVQFNSTEDNNYLENGFMPATLAGELPAAPGSRIYVTKAVTDVTDLVLAGLSSDTVGQARYDWIDAKRKSLVSDCETEAGYRCQVSSFFGGLQFKLIKQLEIKDVRIAYSPADSIGKYGGDIDNWMWPRHTGDFAFYRAYVAPDGSSAEYDTANVPYKPEHTLKVSAAGLENGDFVMAAGYPGRTSRYARLAEVKNTFEWRYPTFETLLKNWIETIETTAPEGSDARVKYEARLAGLNNYMKNLGGQMEGARRVGLVDRRAEREATLDQWIAKNAPDAGYDTAIKELDTLTEKDARLQRQKFWFVNATRPQLLGAARKLYRLAQEKQKPDAERESGYQERDMVFFKQGMQALARRYDPKVDQAEWELFLKGYMAQPEAQRVKAFDTAMMLEGSTNQAVVSSRLNGYYATTKLGDLDTRLSLMNATVAELEASEDPFMKLAIALYETDMAEEAQDKEIQGYEYQLKPQYMEAITAWQKSKDFIAYPDANSTLRITYGNVMGGSPKDGMIYEPFTRLEGIAEKDSGIDPFNSPQKQLDLIAAKDYGPYALKSLKTVPVNFLSDLDVTGGNSGSATLNAKGELVGLLFDGTIESVNSDWDFDPRTTRSIHVDSRYMLWVMEKIDGAGRLIEEMDIVTR